MPELRIHRIYIPLPTFYCIRLDGYQMLPPCQYITNRVPEVIDTELPIGRKVQTRMSIVVG
jgi:hypothetical protein